MDLTYLKDESLKTLPEVLKLCRREEIVLLLLLALAYGNSVRRGHGRDLDMLAAVESVLDNINIHHVVRLSVDIRRVIERYVHLPVDILVLTFDNFKASLDLGTVLMTLVLGYEVIYDVIVSTSGNVIFVNKDGTTWNIKESAMAQLRQWFITTV